MKISKQVGLTIWALFILFVFLSSSKINARVFANHVPQGKEIQDLYLEQLFAPDFPYEWIRVIDAEEGKRFIVIKAKHKISEETEKAYQEKTLRDRNIAIYREHSPRTGNLVLARIRLSRKVYDKPYVIEYCEANPWASRKREKDIAWRDGHYFVLWIDRNFGKKFKKLVIYPEKDADCPLPPQVGKYPNAVALGCSKEAIYPYEKGLHRIVFTYVTKDDPQRVYNFYKDKILTNLDHLGIQYPEGEWKIFGRSDRLGIQIIQGGINIVDEILSSIKGKADMPTGGMVFNILIFQGIRAEYLIKDYSWIQIHYEIEPEIMKERIRKYGKESQK